MKLLQIICLLCACLISVLTHSDIYKYKDENGNWQFSDKPPATDHKIHTVIEARSPASTNAKNLYAALQNKYQPKNEIEKATIAVVKIETALGSGSGFFISETGYLITNKHVIRPPKDTLNNIADEIRKSEEILAKEKERLAIEKDRLRSYKRDLDDYADYVEQLSGSAKSQAEKEYQYRKKNYNKYKKDIARFSKQVNETTRKFTAKKNNYNRRRANAAIARQFTIILKDSTQLSASLIKTSNTHDLALLKVDDHIVPHITLPKSVALGQGSTVFAIGSPLGKKDYVTSGIITSFRKDKIIIDAQILPGNSGGPLIGESGKAIGVNTWKQLSTSSIGSEGFGIAIPIDIVSSEFPNIAGERHPTSESAPQKIETKTKPAENDLMQSILDDYKKTP